MTNRYNVREFLGSMSDDLSFESETGELSFLMIRKIKTTFFGAI